MVIHRLPTTIGTRRKGMWICLPHSDVHNDGLLVITVTHRAGCSNPTQSSISRLLPQHTAANQSRVRAGEGVPERSHMQGCQSCLIDWTARISAGWAGWAPSWQASLPVSQATPGVIEAVVIGRVCLSMSTLQAPHMWHITRA